MYVSIDMDNLVFLHKHADHEVVSALSWLECGTQRSVTITAIDKARFLKTMTAMELKMLYRNTTAGQLGSDNVAELRYQLADAAGLLHVTRALREEVLAQVDAVEDRLHAGEVFRYAFGAQVPAQPQELFPLKGRPLTAPEQSEAAAWARSDLPERTANAPVGPWPERVAPEQDDPTQVTAMAATAESAEVVVVVHKAKRANAQVDIFAAADAARHAVGGPTDPGALKALTKALIPTLEAAGFHPTTIRIKLSKWLKERTS